MGYTTEFEGHFDISPPMNKEFIHFLKELARTRRMKRNVNPVIYGTEGEFYVFGGGYAGQDDEDNIIDYNAPPSTQPGLWCQWIPSEDGTKIEWDGREKFYHYVEWLQYIMNKFLLPRNYTISGQVKYQGEDMYDRGIIKIIGNEAVNIPEEEWDEEDDEDEEVTCPHCGKSFKRGEIE